MNTAPRSRLWSASGGWLAMAAAFALQTAAVAQDGAPTPVSPSPAPSDGPILKASTPQQHGAAMRRWLQAAAKSGLSGAFLVARDDAVLLDEAVGNADYAAHPPVPNTTSTRFDIGSISKQFTAAAILRLQMFGRLSVEDPVVKYFPKVILDPAHGREEMSIRQLLTHTSGIPRNLNFKDVDLTDIDATADCILSSRPERGAMPGERFAYANANYFLLAAIVEKASGKPFEQAMRELVFEPAGLKETLFCGEKPAADDGPIAHGYEDSGSRDPTAGDIGPANERPFAWGHRGATGVLTTTADLLRWHRALAGEKLLDGAAKTLLYKPELSGYAMGWYVLPAGTGCASVEHGGATVGFESMLSRWLPFAAAPPEEGEHGSPLPPPASELPPGTVIEVLSNVRRGWAAPVRDRLIAIMQGKSVSLPPEPADLTDEQRGALSAASGVYTLAIGGSIELRFDSRECRAVFAGQSAMGLVAPVDPEEAALLAERSDAAEIALKGWITGDEQDMAAYREKLHPKVPQSASKNWLTRWAKEGRPEDPPTGLTVLGSMRGDARSGRLISTIVRLEYKRPETVRVIWAEDMIMGIGNYSTRNAPPGGPVVVLTPESPTIFAALDSGSWRTLRVVLVPGEGGSLEKATIRVVSESGETTGRRLSPADHEPAP